jgi:Fe-S cluster assembly protein SufD
MAGISNIQDSYLSLKGRLGGLAPAALMRRDAAVLAAVGLGYPNTRVEDWKYTSLRPLLDKGFCVATKRPKTDVPAADLADLQKTLLPGAMHLVFIDGELSMGLSDTRKAGASISIKTLFEAESTDEGRWKEFDSASGMEHVFAQLAVGFADHGLSLKVEQRIETVPAIHIVHVTTPASQGLSTSKRVVIEVGRLSQVSVVEEFVSIGSTACHVNSLTQIQLDDGANISYTRIDGSGPEVFQTSQITISLARDARADTFSLVTGSLLNRTNLNIVYEAPGGESILQGLYLVKNDQHVDHHTSVHHAAPHCQSNQLYKGIVTVFNGKVFIARGANGSQAYQVNKNLLLSSTAEVDTKPELMIDNDDVKASHGTTVGSLDPQELFYLHSRGISREIAEAMLCRGFADDVVMKAEELHIRKLLEHRVSQWFATFVKSGGV